MVATTHNTVRAHAKGMGRRRVSLVLFAGVAALPLLTMGITVLPAVAKSRAVSEREAMRERLAERESIHRSLRDYDHEGALEELDELHRSLAGMIPTSIEAMDEFGAIRSAAAALDITLVTVRSIRTHTAGAINSGTPGGGNMGGQPGSDPAASSQGAVLVDEVLVNLRAPVDEVFGLVDELRRRGLPTLMLSFDLSRESPNLRAFEAEVRFGFVRRAAPLSGGGDSSR